MKVKSIKLNGENLSINHSLYIINLAIANDDVIVTRDSLVNFDIKYHF